MFGTLILLFSIFNFWEFCKNIILHIFKTFTVMVFEIMEFLF